ncbi:MAG: NAD/NADP octopine/nopaline dehydrogenase family protein [Chloroflexota bacterium]
MTKTKRIAVLGGGNGGHTMAADLTLKGYEVNLCEAPEFQGSIAAALSRQTIDLVNLWGEKHSVKLNLVTTDFAAALKGVSYIMLTIPAIGIKRFCELIASHLEDGQVLLKWSGNFSALALARALEDNGVKKDLVLAETHTLPWACRLTAPGTVQIFLEATKLLLATFPTRQLSRVIREVSSLYPVVAAENVLATSLNNLNPVVHPVGTIMNAGWIDTIGRNFYFYRDGVTLSTARGIKAVFEEVSRLAREVGVQMLEYPEDDFWRKSAIMSSYFRAAFDKEGLVARVSGPSSLKSRYITEDVPFGLVPISRLARQLQVPTPVIDGVIELASVVNQTNYWETGLSLEELGLQNLGQKELARFLNSGI